MQEERRIVGRQRSPIQKAAFFKRGICDLALSGFVLNYPTMPQFVIEREVAGAGKLSQSEIRDLSLRSLEVLKEMGPQIQWLHGYVTEDKVYCVYLAPDENIIREHARRVGIPADRVSAVRRLLDPTKLN